MGAGTLTRRALPEPLPPPPALRRARVSCVCFHILPRVSCPHSRRHPLSAQPHPAAGQQPSPQPAHRRLPVSPQLLPAPRITTLTAVTRRELCLGAGPEPERGCASLGSGSSRDQRPALLFLTPPEFHRIPLPAPARPGPPCPGVRWLHPGVSLHFTACTWVRGAFSPGTSLSLIRAATWAVWAGHPSGARGPGAILSGPHTSPRPARRQPQG